MISFNLRKKKSAHQIYPMQTFSYRFFFIEFKKKKNNYNNNIDRSIFILNIRIVNTKNKIKA